MSGVGIRVEADRAANGMKNLHAGVLQAIKLTLRTAVNAAEESARQTTLWKDQSGGTRESIQGRVIGFKGFVTARGAAKFLEWGTPRHRIPKTGFAKLAFEVNGQKIVRAWVMHPGTAERPFMQQAREAGMLTARYGADVYINYAIEKA